MDVCTDYPTAVDNTSMPKKYHQGVDSLKPVVLEFQDDVALVNHVENLSKKGVPKEDLYVISHDDDRTNRIAEKADANTVGVDEMGFTTAVGNIFRQKGDELRAKFKELGFNDSEANTMERKLDHGKVLLIHYNKAG